MTFKYIVEINRPLEEIIDSIIEAINYGKGNWIISAFEKDLFSISGKTKVSVISVDLDIWHYENEQIQEEIQRLSNWFFIHNLLPSNSKCYLLAEYDLNLSSKFFNHFNNL